MGVPTGAPSAPAMLEPAAPQTEIVPFVRADACPDCLRVRLRSILKPDLKQIAALCCPSPQNSFPPSLNTRT